MEGLLYLQKYGISGPEFGIKEEFVTEKGRQLFHARAEQGGLLSTARPLTGANWNRSFGQWLIHKGKETTAPHDRTKTQHPEPSIDP